MTLSDLALIVLKPMVGSFVQEGHCWRILRRCHSVRRATIGSTDMARRIGRNPASPHTTSKRIALAANIHTELPTTFAARPSNRIPTHASGIPATIPAPDRLASCSNTSLASFPLLAPKAILIPISRVLCVTENASTPYKPTALRNRANPAIVTASVAINLCSNTDESIRSCIVWRPSIGKA